MRKRTPVHLIVCPPVTDQERRDLARSVAAAHADFVLASIDALDCPIAQKRELLRAVIDTIKGESSQNDETTKDQTASDFPLF